MKIKNLKRPIAYVAMSADIIHKGHINILKIADKYGDVVLGLLTDKAISTYKNSSYLNYKNRKAIVENIKYVKKVIPQNTLDYVKNLSKLKPKYLVHGDDWKKGVQKKARARAISVLKKWKGILIEPKYTKNISSTLIKRKILELNKRNLTSYKKK